MKYIKSLFVLLIFSLIFVSCVQQEPPEDTKPDTDTKPPEQKGPVTGGEVTIGIEINNLLIDPLGFNKPKSPIYDITPILYRGLLQYDQQLKLTPDLAAEFNIDHEERVVNIKLKENLNFADGTPLTTDDVKFTLEWYSQRNYNGKWKKYTFNIEGTDVYRTGTDNQVTGIIASKEDNSITIKYNNLDYLDLQLLTAPVLSKKQVADKTVQQIREDAKSGELLATGPFTKNKISQNEWTLNRNDQYEEKVYLEKVIFSEFTENNEYDIVFALPQLLGANNNDKNVVTLEGQGYQYLGMNLNLAELKDANIRRALASTLNYNKIIQDYFAGYATKPLSVIHPKSWMYQAVIIEENVEEAKNILKGKNLSFELAFADTETNRNIAGELSGQLEELGLTINLKPVSVDKYISSLFYRGDYDLFLASWPYELDPVFENEKWLAKKDVLSGGFNVSHVNDPTSDNMLLSGRDKLINGERKEIYEQWQEYFMKQHYIIPLLSPQTILLVNNNLNLEIKNSLRPYASIEKWWLK